MRPLLTVEEYDSYVRYLEVRKLNAEEIARAERTFAEYQNRGVISEGAFQDDVWSLTDEVRTRRLHFHIEPEEYRKGAGSWAGCSRKEFTLCLKAYAAFGLGKRVLAQIYETVRELKLLAGMDLESAFCVKNPRLALDFLSLLPGESAGRDMVMEHLEERPLVSAWKARSQRRLDDFRNYLQFDRKLREYWANADKESRRRYFPVYLWWNLTAVLPLRPTEFLLTPADALAKVNGKYVLSVRRTLMKKKGKRKVSYRIESDYEINRYEIPDALGAEIERYQPLNGESDTLFPSNQRNRKRLSYVQLKALLYQFLAEELHEDCVSIRLGDTRHLAMINLMLSGGSPTVCKALAGHEDIAVSAHYYSNLSSIIESSVYERFRGDSQEAALEGRMYFPLSLPGERVRIQDGWCDYPAVMNGDVRECLKNCAHSGDVGDCVNCVHFYPERKGLRLKITDERKRAVDESAAFLMQMIEQVRQGKQMKESIASAMARLQDNSRRYANALRRKLETEAE